MNFHIRLKQLMDTKGVIQKQVAIEIGVSQRVVSYYLNRSEPSYETLCKLADYFEVSLDYLLGREFSSIDNLEKQNIQLLQENTYLQEKLGKIEKVMQEG